MSRYVENFEGYLKKLEAYFWMYIEDKTNTNPVRTHNFIIYPYSHKICSPLAYVLKETEAKNICLWYNELIFSRIHNEAKREEHGWERYHSKFLDKIMDNFAIGDKIAVNYDPETYMDNDGIERIEYKYNWLTIVKKQERLLTVKDENKFICSYS